MKDREAWHSAAFMGSQRVGHDCGTEQQQDRICFKEEAARMRGDNTGSLDITLGRSQKKEKEDTRNIFKCHS